MPKIINSFDPAGTLTSVLPREGIDIGPAPDFWRDFGDVLSRFRRPSAPAPRAPVAAPRQAAALRTAPPREGPAPSTGHSGPPRRPIFTKMTQGRPGMETGRILAEQWEPGAVFSGWAL